VWMAEAWDSVQLQISIHNQFTLTFGEYINIFHSFEGI
jgi:hypothetical protein